MDPIAIGRWFPVAYGHPRTPSVAQLLTAVLGVAGAGTGAARPLIALEQIRMLARLRAMTKGSAGSDELPIVAGGAALALAAGFAFRGVARSARQVLPASMADAAVAAAGSDWKN